MTKLQWKILTGVVEFGGTVVRKLIWNQNFPPSTEFRHTLWHPLLPWSMIIQISADAAAFCLLLSKAGAEETWGNSGNMITLWHGKQWHVLKSWSWDCFQVNVDKKATIKLLTFPGMGRLHSMMYFNCKSLDLMQGSLGLNCSLTFPVMLLWLTMGISFLYFPLLTMFWNSYSKAKNVSQNLSNAFHNMDHQISELFPSLRATTDVFRRSKSLSWRQRWKIHLTCSDVYSYSVIRKIMLFHFQYVSLNSNHLCCCL